MKERIKKFYKKHEEAVLASAVGVISVIVCYNIMKGKQFDGVGSDPGEIKTDHIYIFLKNGKVRPYHHPDAK